jgi:hypothetical protein
MKNKNFFEICILRPLSVKFFLEAIRERISVDISSKLLNTIHSTTKKTASKLVEKYKKLYIF